jgi:hypothetical protein
MTEENLMGNLLVNQAGVHMEGGTMFFGRVGGGGVSVQIFALFGQKNLKKLEVLVLVFLV